MSPLPNALLRTDLVFVSEALLMLLALVLSFVIPQQGQRLFRKIMQGFTALSRQPVLSLLLVGLVAFGGSAFVGLLVRFPEPAVHDEFSYLLSADTFASGRLANPSHPMWEHFESFHIIQQPTYASKYPPGQGVVLALGQLIGGHPATGIWLGIAFACVAICWMLQGWVPRRWALLGGVLAALNLGFFGYWSQNYWGGAVAAAGGALLFGAARRLLRQAAILPAVLMGLGLIILANTRPFEGLIVSIPAACLFLSWMWKPDWPTLRRKIMRVFLPLCGVVILGALWMGFYNYRVTGHPIRMPYHVHERTYSYVPVFLWDEPGPVPDRCYGVFKDHQESFHGRYLEMRTWLGFWRIKFLEFYHIVLFYLRFVFLVPLLFVPFLWRDRWVRFASLVSILLLAFVLAEIQTMPRKLAPATCLLMFLVIQGLRCLRTGRGRRRPDGASLAAAILLICIVSVAASFWPLFHAPEWPPSQQRRALLSELAKDQDHHLIIVRYEQQHWPYFEWVYNKADIDEAKVVWGRELDAEKNRELMEYFKNRKIWLLKADLWTVGQLELVPYSSREEPPVE